MLPEIILILTLTDINNVLAILGDLPSKSGVYPLIAKIQQTAENQKEALAQQKPASFNLTEKEAEAIIQAIGILPTNSNAWPLFNALNEQVKNQDKVLKYLDDQQNPQQDLPLDATTIEGEAKVQPVKKSSAKKATKATAAAEPAPETA